MTNVPDANAKCNKPTVAQPRSHQSKLASKYFLIVPSKNQDNAPVTHAKTGTKDATSAPTSQNSTDDGSSSKTFEKTLSEMSIKQEPCEFQQETSVPIPSVENPLVVDLGASTKKNSTDAFIIYTKSADKVAEMLTKGLLKLTLKLPLLSRAAETMKPSGQQITRSGVTMDPAGSSTTTNPVSCASDPPGRKTPTGAVLSTSVIPPVNLVTPTGTVPSTSVLPIPPVKLVVRRQAHHPAASSSSTPATSHSPDEQQRHGSSLSEDNPVMMRDTNKVKEETVLPDSSRASGTDVSSEQEPLIHSTSSPVNMIAMLKKGEMKVLISQL